MDANNDAPDCDKRGEAASVIKAIAVDCGGVLLKMRWTAALRRWEELLNMGSRSLGPYIWSLPCASQATVGEISADVAWREVGTALGLSECATSRLRYDFDRADTVNFSLLRFLASLSTGVHIAIATNSWSDAHHKLRRVIRALPSAPATVISSEIGAAKPSSIFYERLLSRLDVCGEECILIDDSRLNVNASSFLNIEGVLFRSNTQCITDIRHVLTRC